MKFYRANNPKISLALVPWYVPGEKTAFEIGIELNDRLREQPDDTYVLLAMEGEKAKAFLAAYIENEHVHIWQARKKKGFKYSKLMFYKLIEWAGSKDKNRLTCSTPDKRLRRLYRRRFGFSPLEGDWMEKKI